MKVKGRGQKNLDAFLSWVAETFPQITRVEVVDSLEAIVRDSDIVTFCASGATGDPATYPTVKREWVRPGTFLSMPAPCNIDRGMESPDVRKVLDNTGLYEAYAEEHPKPVIGSFRGGRTIHGSRRPRPDRSRAPRGSGENRQRGGTGSPHEDEIIILSVGGMAVEDVAWGTVVYRNAVAQGIGVRLNLWHHPLLR